MSDYATSINTDLYKYAKRLYITEPTGNKQTHIPLRLNLNSSNFNFDLAKSDGKDFRLAEASNGTGVFHMWIAYWNNTTRIATVWFKIPELLANETRELWAFWGFEYDTGTSDLEVMIQSPAVFLFADDFDGTSLDTSKWPTSLGSMTISDSKINLGTDAWIRTDNVLGGKSAYYNNIPYQLGRYRGLFGNHQYSGNCYLAYNGSLSYTQTEIIDGDYTSYNTYSYFGTAGCLVGVDLGSIKSNISFLRVYIYNYSQTFNGTLEYEGPSYPSWIDLYKTDTNEADDQVFIYTYSEVEIPLVKADDYLWYVDLPLDAPGESTRYFHVRGRLSFSPVISWRVSELEVWADDSTITIQPGKFMVEEGIVGIGSPVSTSVAAHRYRFYGGDNVMGINYYWEGATDRTHDFVYAGTYSTYNGVNRGLIAGEYAQLYVGYYEPTDRVYQGASNRGGDPTPQYSENIAIGGTAQASDAHGYKPPANAFDGDFDTSWGAIQQSPSGTWIGYELPTAATVTRIKLYNFGILGTYNSDHIDIEIQGSNDTSTTNWALKSWDVIYSTSTTAYENSDRDWVFTNHNSYIFIRIVYAYKAFGEPILGECEMFTTTSYAGEFDYDDSWERKVHRNTEVSNFRIYGEDTVDGNGVAIDWVIAREFEPARDPLVNYSELFVEHEYVAPQPYEETQYLSDITDVDFFHSTDMGGDPYTMSDDIADSPSNIFMSDDGVVSGTITIDFGRNKFNVVSKYHSHFHSDNTIEFYNSSKLSDLDTDVHERNYWATTTTSGWAAITFPATRNLSSLSFTAIPGSADRLPNNFKFYGSNSDPRFAGWYDKVLLYEGTALETETEQVFYFNTGLTFYKYYILEVLDTHGGNVGIQEWAMFERDATIGRRVVSQLRLRPVTFLNGEYNFVKEIELYGSNDGNNWDLLLPRTATATPFTDGYYGRWSRYSFTNFTSYYLYRLVCYDNWRSETERVYIAEWEMVERAEEADNVRVLDGTTNNINNIWADPTATISSGTVYMTNDVFNSLENYKLLASTTVSGNVDDFNVKL